MKTSEGTKCLKKIKQYKTDGAAKQKVQQHYFKISSRANYKIWEITQTKLYKMQK